MKICCLISTLIFGYSTIINSQKSNSKYEKLHNTKSEITKPIRGFLAWYKSNYLRLYEYLLTYSDSNKNYRVNKINSEKYLKEIQSTGFVSKEFIRLWREYINSQDEKFKMNPQNEGPPEGFDFDLMLNTQEPEEVLNKIPQIEYKLIEVKNNTSIVHADTKMKDWIYVIELIKIRDKWYIDYISLKEPD